MTYDEIHMHKKALKLEVGILRDRYESPNGTGPLHTAVNILESRIGEIDDILVFKGFLEG